MLVFVKEFFVMDGNELNLSVYVMPCKQMLTVSVKLSDSIAVMKQKLSVRSLVLHVIS